MSPRRSTRSRKFVLERRDLTVDGDRPANEVRGRGLVIGAVQSLGGRPHRSPGRAEENLKMSTQGNDKEWEELVGRLSASTAVNQWSSAVLAMVRHLRLPFQSCAIFLQAHGKLEPVLRETPYRDLLAMSHLLHLRDRLIDEVLETLQPRLASELPESSHDRIFKDERSAIGVPLLVGEEATGVLYLGAVKAGAYNLKHLHQLRRVATLAASTLQLAGGPREEKKGEGRGVAEWVRKQRSTRSRPRIPGTSRQRVGRGEPGLNGIRKQCSVRNQPRNPGTSRQRVGRGEPGLNGIRKQCSVRNQPRNPGTSRQRVGRGEAWLNGIRKQRTLRDQPWIPEASRQRVGRGEAWLNGIRKQCSTSNQPRIPGTSRQRVGRGEAWLNGMRKQRSARDQPWMPEASRQRTCRSPSPYPRQARQGICRSPSPHPRQARQGICRSPSPYPRRTRLGICRSPSP